MPRFQNGFTASILYLSLLFGLLLATASHAQSIGDEASQQFLYVKRVEFLGFEPVSGLDVNQQDLSRWVDDYLAEEYAQGKIKRRSDDEYELSLEQCHLLADALTLELRRRGLQFFQAYIAPQAFRHKTLEISLQSGKLERIHIIGQSGLSHEAIRAQLAHLQGHIILRQRIEPALLLLNEYPGFESFAFYSRGLRPGFATLNLKLKPKARASALSLLDNYGSESTGENRLINRLDISRVLFDSDRFELGFLQAFEPDNSQYAWFNYSVLLAPRWQWSLGASNNQFDLGSQLNLLEIDGDVLSAHTELRYKLKRSRRRHHDVGLRAQLQQFEQNSTLLNAASLLSQEHSAVSLFYRWQSSFGRVAQALAFDATAIDWQEGNLHDDEPWRVQLHYRALFDWGRSHSLAHNQLHLIVSGQHTQMPLPALLRQGNTASSGFRALAPGLFASDRRALVRLDWHYLGLPKFWGLKVVPYLFSDGIYAQQLYYDQTQQLQSSTLLGHDYGVGMLFHLGKQGNIRLSYGLGAELEFRQGEDVDALADVATDHLLLQFTWQWGAK